MPFLERLVRWLGNGENRFMMYLLVGWLLTQTVARMLDLDVGTARNPTGSFWWVFVPIMAVLEAVDWACRRKALLVATIADLNVKQRWCIWLTGTAVLASILFPPWWWSARQAHIDLLSLGGDSKRSFVLGGKQRAWVFDPPLPPGDDYVFEHGIVYKELALQIAVIALLGLGLIWVVQDRGKKKNPLPDQ